MKKTLLATTLLTLSMSAKADFLLGGDVEVNAWMPDVTIAEKDADSVSGPAYTAEASFEHLIPLIPNLKVGATTLSDGGLDYSKVDAILYYEILDNDIVSIDVGLGGSKMDISGQTADWDLGDASGTLATAYANAEVGIPATPLYFYAKALASSDGDTSGMDASAGMKYTLDLALLELDLQVGYRVQNWDLEGFDGTNGDIEISGAYAGVNVDF